MTAAGSLRWESLPPLWSIILVIVPLILLTVRFFYRREAGRVGRRPRMTMGVLRILAILLVLGALWGPYTESVEKEPFKRHLIIAIDTSESMGFRDDYTSTPELAKEINEAAGYPANTDLSQKPRLEIVRDIMGADLAYLERLADVFRVHVYTFDSAPAGLVEQREGESPKKAARRIRAALPRLRPTGSVTRIGTAIRDLTRVFDAKNEPVAGILLFTDGRHTGGAPNPVEEAQRAKSTRNGIRLFPVAMGNPAATVNVAVSRIDAPRVVLAGDKVSFTVYSRARGLEGAPAELEAWVLDEDNKPRERLAIDVPPFPLPADNADPKRVTFRHTFHEPGTFNLKIGVPPMIDKGEAIHGDNYGIHVLQVAKLKMRVLLVAQLPSYTYRFLKEALLRARGTIDADTLLLVAEAGWPQGSSEGMEPLTEKGFPATKAELAQYDVVILLDVDPKSPRMAPKGGSEAMLDRIEAWVKAGAGLVLQAGRSQSIPNDYANTPIMALMPVVPFPHLREDAYQAILNLRETKRYRLTSAGRNHPVMHILEDADAAEFWDGNDYATQYIWYAPVLRTKSSATALAVRRSVSGRVYHYPEEKGQDGATQPLLAIQPYGLGKVFWVGTDELWRMRKGLVNDPNLYYWRFWSGVIRHLATYRLLSMNRRIKIWVDRTDARYRVGDSIGVEAKFLDRDFEPVKSKDSTRRIKLRTPKGDEEEITLHGVGNEPPEGLFRTTIHAGEPGTYRLIAESDGSDDPAEKTFVVESTTIEMSDPLMDTNTISAIARESGGIVLSPGQFRDLLEIDRIPREGEIRSGETHRTELWDRSWVLWLFVGLLAAEWILRRLNLLL